MLRGCAPSWGKAAHFVGNSMGAIMLLTDATSDAPRLPVRTMVAVCGGGQIQRNQYMQALYEYDATFPAMRRIVEAFFYDRSYPADDNYVRSSLRVEHRAWSVGGGGRGAVSPPRGAAARPLPRAHGRTSASTCPRWPWRGGDRLLPAGWAAEIAKQVDGGRCEVVDRAGHCPQSRRRT
jgi:hypothetical protein